MPKYINQTVECPHCGKKLKIKRFTTIDDKSMPKENQMIFKDELFNIKCPYCHTASMMPYSFAWRDSKHDILLQYAASPEEKTQYLEEYEGEEGVRVLDNYKNLQEKIMIFKEGYDDRLVEVEKIFALQIMRQHDSKIDHVSFVYNMMHNMAEILGEIKGKTREILPSDQLYKLLQKDFETDLEDYNADTLIVDRKWAEDFLKYADPDGKKFSLEDEKTENKDEITTFFESIDELEMEGDEKQAAELIVNSFDETWQAALAGFSKKPSLMEVDQVHEGAYNACSELDMILLNEKKYEECMHVMKTMLDTLDFDNDILLYHNFRKSYLEAMTYAKGKEAALDYLENWKKEEPDSAYVKGAEIDFWLGQDKEKAAALAEQYVDIPLKQEGDDWLLDACENVVIETKNKDLEKKINKARKKSGRY